MYGFIDSRPGELPAPGAIKKDLTFVLLSYYNVTMNIDNRILTIPSKRRKATSEFWLRVATDLNAGMTPDEIAGRYINPKTEKPYTREHIYWVIRQLKKRIIEK